MYSKVGTHSLSDPRLRMILRMIQRSAFCLVGVQVRFFEVSEEELQKKRSAFSNGQLKIKIEHQEFSMR